MLIRYQYDYPGKQLFSQENMFLQIFYHRKI